MTIERGRDIEYPPDVTRQKPVISAAAITTDSEAEVIGIA